MAIAAQALMQQRVNDWPEHIELEYRVDDPSGYGSLVRQLTKAMVENGREISVHSQSSIIDRMPSNPRPLELVETCMGPRWVYAGTEQRASFGTKIRKWVCDHPVQSWEIEEIIYEPGTRDAVRLSIGLPEGAVYEGANRRVLYTMWESTEVPTKFRPWAPHLRRPNLILVPAEHSRKVFLDAVPEADVRIVPLGTDADDWPFIEREDSDTFIFLMVGDLSIRKSFQFAYQAFWQAFGEQDDVALVFKSRGGGDLMRLEHMPKYVPQTDRYGRPIYGPGATQRYVFNKDRVRYFMNTTDENVLTLRGDWSRAGLLKLYQMADCFVWPTSGEGWGYPPREAAATGLPVITCAHTGQADAGDWAYVIPHHDEAMRALFRHWGGECGRLPLPDVKALSQAMRWVYEHRDEARDFGREASRIVTRRTSADVGRDILDHIATMEV